MKDSRGFSLLELLLVVVAIGIICAIVVPNLMAARRVANEASAIAELKLLNAANYSFFAVYGTFTSPNTLYSRGFINDDFGERVKLPANIQLGGGSGDDGVEQLGPPSGVIHDEIPVENNPFRVILEKSGYYFIMVPVEVSVLIDSSIVTKYQITEFYKIAVPKTYFTGGFYQTGTRGFYTDSLSNAPWSVNDYPSKIDCFNESGSRPEYEFCTQVGSTASFDRKKVQPQ
ncbi:MAG: prepilin-type N-terminal cleavage/methylation domain-containing protein [Acidobacteriota bacterium]